MDDTKHFQTYQWKNGSPFGTHPSKQEGNTFKIVSDPYYKRISIEAYFDGVFQEIIYDSALLDFRHLKTPQQYAWQKTVVEESATSSVCLIRNQDDRVLFQETYIFEHGLCRSCKVHSPQGILLSTHQMFYKKLDDEANGVVLFDSRNTPVMYKLYEHDPDSGEFTELLKEEWFPSANHDLNLSLHSKS
ncbi:MAG: hypothetical protein H0X51_09410 [Parachlamydiaceae bacterium]|nr:hypothetical protein [Parachlamydiaceae bacterium]